MTSKPAKILVVDDDRVQLTEFQALLEANGYVVAALQDGDEVLPALDKERPDLLLLDILMPKIDGLNVLKLVKRHGQWRDIPVLMISCLSPEEATVEALELGASDFIAKPFRPQELVARIEAQLRAGRALREARLEARQRAGEAAIQAEMLDILHEVTAAFAPVEIYRVLARRVANALSLARCSVVLAKHGDPFGRVVVAAEEPSVRDLEVRLDRYPEIVRALETNRAVLVHDVHSDPLYAEIRKEWDRTGTAVSTRSVIAIPFSVRGVQSGVFFLRTIENEAALTGEDVVFAERVVHTAVSVVEKAYALEAARSAKERYEILASTDPLTGCLNRRALSDRLEDELERAQRYALALSVLMVDIDDFKQVNDAHGHRAGDEVLRDFGDLLRREVRGVDVVARYGGDEFVVILPETSLPGAVSSAERIRKRIAEHVFTAGEATQPITVSIGLATAAVGEAAAPHDLLARADSALFSAKETGRNSVRS
jgi:diguanylate cyclase (GGDEF)-like protein